MPLRIRDAIHRDLAEIVEIEKIAFPNPWSFDSFERELTLPFSRIVVATTGDGENGSPSRVNGFLCRWLIAGECHVLNIAVHPDFRRAGIGEALLNTAITEARGQRAGLVTLEVRRSNLPARCLYRKHRFLERRLRRHYYGPGEDAIVMELALD